jgi:deoxyhypusine synthase
MLVPVEVLIAGTGLATGLVGSYVGLKNRVLLAEVQKEAAELETRMVSRICNIYVRAGECRLQEDQVRDALCKLAEEVRGLAQRHPHQKHGRETPPDR